jgi:hypothetical protein
VFGGIYIHDGATAQTIATGTTYAKLTGFNTAQGVNGAGVNCTPDKANSKITVGKIGWYHVLFTMSASCNTSNCTFTTVVFLSGAEQQMCEGSSKMSNSTDVVSSSGQGYIHVTSLAGTGGDIDIRSHHDLGGNVDLTVKYLNLTVQFAGD